VVDSRSFLLTTASKKKDRSKSVYGMINAKSILKKWVNQKYKKNQPLQIKKKLVLNEYVHFYRNKKNIKHVLNIHRMGAVVGSGCPWQLPTLPDGKRSLKG